jgi:hypothetical protein
MSENIDKHSKYYNYYKPNDLFWGLGIETELYLMSQKKLNITKEDILTKHHEERYSVNYFDNFKKEELQDTLDKLIKTDSINIPFYINAHTFIKNDINGNSTRLYTKDNEVNPEFNGQTIFNLIQEQNNYFKENYEHKYTFDGDTIEFMTINYYKNTVNNIVQELEDTKLEFLNNLNKEIENIPYLQDHCPLIYSDSNYGFVNFLTNYNYFSMCNNGTYHINITLPTKLDEDCNIDDLELFEVQHLNAIRAIQYIEPLLVACYGSGDILSLENNNYAKGSLRLAMSRYISMGNYVTKKKKEGKLLHDSKLIAWYNKYHDNSNYVKLDKIGLDINFKKFRNHGIEIRIFDYFPLEYIKDVINLLILICDMSLEKKINNIVDNNIYQETCVNAVKNGYSGIVNKEYIKILEEVFEIKLDQEHNFYSCLEDFSKELYNKFKNSGQFSNLVSPNMPEIKIVNINKYIEDMNKKIIK